MVLKKYKRLEEMTYNLETKYNFFNKKLFGGSLPNIQLSWKTKTRGDTVGLAYGNTEIVLNKTKLENFSEKNIDAVLIHEMIHIWVANEGYPDKGNIHQGAFNVKAKELAKVTGLKLTGTTLRDSDDLELKYQDKKKIPVWVVVKNYFTPEIKLKTLDWLEFFSSEEKAISFAKEQAEKRTQNVKFVVLRIETNSPIVEYDTISKYLDKVTAWVRLNSLFVKSLVKSFKEFPKYVKVIDYFPHHF